MNHLATPPGGFGGDDDDKYLNLLTMILERQDTIIEKQEDTDKALAGHMEREEAAIGRWMESLPKTVDGKPDIEGHRVYHQELIEEARERKKMWRDLRSELLKKTSWAILAVVGALILYWWNHEVRK